jgi:hypothetical protein
MNTPTNHAATRWVTLVRKALESPHDPRTMKQWAHAVGVSVGTLRVWCRNAGVSPIKSRDFTRLLRAVSIASEEGWRIQDALDVVDPRTLRALMVRAGLEAQDGGVIGRDQYLARQRFVQSHHLIELVCDHHDQTDECHARAPSDVANRPRVA